MYEGGSGWGDTECREYLRFTKAEIAQLVNIFINKLKKVRCPASGERALCMVLYRLAWPTRLKDMVQTFHYSRSYISNVVNATVSLSLSYIALLLMLLLML